jgi:radical SAM protein with 4Fe4S-binding SPASM domain
MGHYRKNLISFNLTNACNLRCHYCWAAYKKNDTLKVLDVEFAKRGLYDFFHETGSNYLGFTASGEPTLQINLMDEIVTYARSLIGNIKVELQTNAVFNQKVRDWIFHNIDILWISGDGPREFHDVNRITQGGQGTSAIVDRNLKTLLDMQTTTSKDMVIGVRATIGNYNVYKQKELIDYYRTLGVRAIYADQICLPVANQNHLTSAVGPLVFAEQFYEAYTYAKSLDIFYGTIATVNFDEPVTIACRSLIPMPHLMPDGFVSCCEMCYEKDSPLDIFIYGKWNQDEGIIEYDPEKIELIKTRTIHNLEEECRACEFLQNCAGGCVGDAFNATGSLYKRNQEVCMITKYLAERMERNEGIYPYLHS